MSKIQINELSAISLNTVEEREISKIVGGRGRSSGNRNRTKIVVDSYQDNFALVIGKRNYVDQYNDADIDIDVDN